MYYKIAITVFLFITNISWTFCASESNLPCSYNYPVVTDFTPEICTKRGLFYFKNAGIAPNNCLPGCVKRQGEGKPCNNVSPNDTKKCAPGLKCDASTCVIDEVSCMKYKYLNLPSTVWKPTCLPDGTYEPKQCKGESENGRCFCFDAYGKRIFGQQWSDKAKNMTCACSRRRSELVREGRTDVTLHCDSMGNYEPLQCDSGLCWCAEPETGRVVENIVPESMMTFLPCYKKSEIGEQYLRTCESEAFAQAKITKELLIHGTTQISLPFIVCDWDGSYGKYKILNGIVYCTLRDNTNAGTWATQVVGNMDEKINCNCAKDTNIYKEAGLTLTLRCEGNGNYQKVQVTTYGKFFCADSDGFATTGLMDDEIPVEECPKV